MSADRPVEAPPSTAAPKPRRWLRAAPVLVLLVAIAAQAILMTTVNADRQSGSGFAMFSSVDFAGSRSVVVEAAFGDDLIEAQVPAQLASDVDDLLRSPTNDKATELAERLHDLAWNVDDDQAQASGSLSAKEIHVTVRGLTADGRQLSATVLASGSST